MIYNFYLFDRRGKLLFYSDYMSSKTTAGSSMAAKSKALSSTSPTISFESSATLSGKTSPAGHVQGDSQGTTAMALASTLSSTNGTPQTTSPSVVLNGTPWSPTMTDLTVGIEGLQLPGITVATAAAAAAAMSHEESSKLVYGALYSLRNVCSRLSRKPDGDPEVLWCFKTSAYKSHIFESPTGLTLILNTDPHVAYCREALRHIYANIYVEKVAKNPLIKKHQSIQCDAFRTALLHYLQNLSYYQ